MSAIQFYDWAWKHEFLVSKEENYGDPLGAQICRSKIIELIYEYEKVGTLAVGYVAVYAVNLDGWERWQKSGLFNEDGEPYKLGEDFLWIVDPADEYWLPHLTQQLKHDMIYWKELLEASGGKLELTKCFHYIFSWEFDE